MLAFSLFIRHLLKEKKWKFFRAIPPYIIPPSLTPLRYIFVCGSLKRVKKKEFFFISVVFVASGLYNRGYLFQCERKKNLTPFAFDANQGNDSKKKFTKKK